MKIKSILTGFVALFVLVVAAFAQTSLSLTPTVTETPSFFTSLLTNGTALWPTLISIVTSLFAVWHKSQSTTAQKVAQSLVKVVEAAASLPEGQAVAAKLKAMATAEATALGVQDDLHAIVTRFTSQT